MRVDLLVQEQVFLVQPFVLDSKLAKVPAAVQNTQTEPQVLRVCLCVLHSCWNFARSETAAQTCCPSAAVAAWLAS